MVCLSFSLSLTFLSRGRGGVFAKNVGTVKALSPRDNSHGKKERKEGTEEERRGEETASL